MSIKINGWKRLGIIASVVWVIGAYFYTLNAAMERNISLNVEIENSCAEVHRDEPNDPCFQEAVDSAMRQLPGEREEAAIVALLPVPVAWGVTYLVLFLVRWVRRGFQAK